MVEAQDLHDAAMNASNDGYTSAGMAQMRLDTGPLLDNIEAFLRGKRILRYEETKEGYRPVFGAVGKPKANEEGIQSIMQSVSQLFSPHTVQGNFADRQELNEFLCYVQKGLAKDIMANRVDWDIKRQDYSGIIRKIMFTAEPFFSRLIGNKERDSYATTMRIHENASYGEDHGRGGGGGGLWSGFFGGRR